MARTDLLTMDRVGNMTTYELRQEADARGLLKDLRPVNHQTLMKRLVQVGFCFENIVRLHVQTLVAPFVVLICIQLGVLRQLPPHDGIHPRVVAHVTR